MQQDKQRFMKGTEGTLYDSVTSLTWMAKDSRLDLERDVNWEEAEQYTQDMNDRQFGGHNDWRIPSNHEASSLYDESKLNKDFKNGDIHIDSIFPPGCGNTTWTAETRGKEAQIVFYLNGSPYWYVKNDKTISHSVRLVHRG